MTINANRYAIYFAPSETSKIGQFGRLLLKRTAKKMVDEGMLTDLPKELHRKIIKTPQHYGFHGTLKAPFELHPDYNLYHLDTTLIKFCSSFPDFSIKSLKLQIIAEFIALVPNGEVERLYQLHRKLTEEFNYLCGPLSDFDRDRFLARGLTNGQKKYLCRYGYPFILDSFKFHLTLTSSLTENEQTTCLELLDNMIVDFKDERLSVDRVCLFKQETRKSPFFMVKEYNLQGR